MQGLTKGLLGAGVASLLAWGTHAMDGADYIDTIEADMQAALAASGADGASLTMQRDPLARVAVLDGVTDPAERARIEEYLRANSTVGSIRWADDMVADAEVYSAELASGDGASADGASAADATTGASEELVADCQGDIDGFMEGKSITFRTGSAYLAPSSLTIIDGLSERLGPCTGMSIAVGGHTDATGTDAVNQQISQARADSVAAALTERGVAASRITATGYGSSQPLAGGDGSNAANRRIEFTLDAGGSAGAAAQEGE